MNFRLGSIPVHVRLEFFILPAVGLMSLGVERGLLWVLLVFGSVLWHELGHAWAMRAAGYAPSIELHGLGGWTLWPSGARPSHRQRLAVTLAGPGIELMAGLLVHLSRRWVELPPLAEWARDQFVWVNLAWGLINLLPILPWDGGLALDSLVSLITGKSRARLVGVVSLVFGAATAVAAVWLFSQNVMLIYLGVVGVWKGWQRLSEPEASEPPPEADQAWRLSSAGRHAEAVALLEQALQGTPKQAARLHLLEVLAWVRLSDNDPEGAERTVQQMGGDATRASPELLARLAAFRQRPQEVVEVLWTPASELRLRPEAWPLLLSAMDDRARSDRLLGAVAAQAAQSNEARAVVAAIAEKLFHSEHLQPANELCQRAFEACRDPLFAFNAACCLCRLGTVDEGLRWLTVAVEAGYRSPAPLEEDPDLAPLRGHPTFAALSEKARGAASGQPT